MPASLGATTGGDLDLDIINAPLSPRETIKTGHGKANANIINIVHLCSVQRREGWSGCSHTPGDTHNSATSSSPLLGGGDCRVRSGTSGWRVPRLELTGTRPEVSSILASCSLSLSCGVSKERGEASGSRRTRRGRQRSFFGGHIKPLLRIPAQSSHKLCQKARKSGRVRARRTCHAHTAPPTSCWSRPLVRAPAPRAR